jgi:hypothetical protein
MVVSDKLDEIFKLGFWITINWKEEFGIYYNANDVVPATAYSIRIMDCSYYTSKTNPYSFEKMIEVCCDMFFNWYNKNLSVINDFDKNYNKDSMSKLEDVCLGDVTKVVARELNLEDVLKVIIRHYPD